ncbi:hypothetical protein LCGC14_1853660 [marine sediment metagenome]|uniref:Uncharacterized protein n=1 Tax=marine sediment metagenome TaxID=412755 RepID=A0A0F9J8T1_9ZZZZ
MAQTAQTGNLASAQRIVIEQARYTAEHNAPMLQLVEQFKLKKGEKQIDVPKVGQFTATAVGDGVDITDEQDIGMTITTMTTSEVGLKIILTDKLVTQMQEDTMKIVGRQAGDAMARKKDNDLTALFSSLNGGTDLGGTGVDMEVGNFAVLINFLRVNAVPKPWYIVQHPGAMTGFAVSTYGFAANSLAGSPAVGGGIGAPGFTEGILKDFYAFSLSGVPVFHDGNITVDSADDARGAVLSKSALAYAESIEYRQETERDASLRANELVWVSDYGVFELDDGYGAGTLFNTAFATA